MSERVHNVSVRVGSKVIERWTDYDVSCDMLTAADSFSLSIGDPARDEVFDLVAPDEEVQILLDDTAILSGLVDAREGTSSRGGGSVIQVSGRDRAGRLVDESMELVSFVGMTLDALAKKVAGPWFESVTLSNAANRMLIRGRGAKIGKVAREPAIDRTPRAPRKVQPGESRWNVLAHFLREGELLAWATADGKTLVVGLPNYDQAPSYHFFHAREGSPRQVEANVIDFHVRDSVAERYSRVIAVGSSPGDLENFGDRVSRHRGSASNGTGAYGIGADFKHRKVLLVSDDSIHNAQEAQKRAAREMAERDAAKHTIELQVGGHDQLVAGARRPTLYAFDTMARVESEKYGIDGLYLVTAVNFHHDRDSGETTRISLVPKGTVLRL